MILFNAAAIALNPKPPPPDWLKTPGKKQYHHDDENYSANRSRRLTVKLVEGPLSVRYAKAQKQTAVDIFGQRRAG